MTRAKCPQCDKIIEHKKRAVFNRMMGMHMAAKHGHIATNTDWASELNAEVIQPSVTADPAAIAKAKAREYQRQWWAKNKGRYAKQQQQPQKQHSVNPVALEYCPHCGARFYMAIGP